MQTAFEDACVTGYADLVESMTNDTKDRHVLAAAVRTGAHAILTENVKHFPAESVEPYNFDVLTPDQFLAHQYEALVHKLSNWAPALSNLLLESA